MHEWFITGAEVLGLILLGVLVVAFIIAMIDAFR